MQGAKETYFLHFKRKYISICAIKVSKISSINFHTSSMQDATIKCTQKKNFKVFSLCYRNGSFECYFTKKRPKSFKG